MPEKQTIEKMARFLITFIFGLFLQAFSVRSSILNNNTSHFLPSSGQTTGSDANTIVYLHQKVNNLQLQIHQQAITMEELNKTLQVQNKKMEVQESVIQELLNITRQTSSVENSRVGFTVGMPSYNDSWSGDTVVFPVVFTNIENGYNASTGKFTAPKAGTYVFFVSVVSYNNNSLSFDIVHNGESNVRTWSDGSASHQTASNLAVLELSQGDNVWVRRFWGKGYYSWSVPMTTFSGFLL